MKQHKFDWGALIAIIILVGIVTIAILTLTGPAIGNVFSNVVTNLQSPSDAANSGAPRPVSSSSESSDSAANWDDEMAAIQPVDRLVIKNGELDLMVEDTHQAIDRVMQIATRYGGYVQSSEISGEDDQLSAYLTITVRAEDFERAFNDLRSLAIKVQNERATGEDVSAEYVDLESRLRNLQATENRLRAFLNEANGVTEALRVSEELEKVEAEIEQVKGRMNYLGERAALSTINVHLAMPATVDPTPTQVPWALQATIEKSVETQITLAQFLLETVTWLVIVIGPYAVVAGLAAYILRLWMHKRTSP